MKKFLLSLALIFATLPALAIDEKLAERTIPLKAPHEIGFKILNANNIEKRVVFKTVSSVKNPYYVGFSHSWKPESAHLTYADRTITVWGDTLELADNNDELAAILSQEIAQALESYKGTFRGFFSSGRYELDPRKYENKADLKAVDYMVNTGYNPVALIVMYNKTLGQTRYEWCHYYPLATKRMMNVYEHIHNNYPQYLANNVYANNIYYQNFLMNSENDIQKFSKKIEKAKRRG